MQKFWNAYNISDYIIHLRILLTLNNQKFLINKRNSEIDFRILKS